MRELLCSTVERNVLLQCLKNRKRLDCRTTDESRSIKIDFRSHPGHVSVSLGQTCVLAQISSQIIKPKETRSNIGILRIHLNTSQIPKLTLENFKHFDYSQLLNQILEKNICQSDCVDLESLCIRAGEYVWSIKIDLIALNYDGNLLDCANLAALCALAHYRLPEISVRGTEIRVFSSKERSQRPLRIFHYPINVSFACFVVQNCIIFDPDADEERFMDGFLTISINQNRELCDIYINGDLSLKREQIDFCQRFALKKALTLTALIDENVKNYYKTMKPKIQTQPSIVVTNDDGEDEEQSNESEAEELLEPVSPITLALVPGFEHMHIGSATSDGPTDIVDH